MDNCFLCSAKLKRKTHYLCKTCYEKSTKFYDDFIDECNDVDQFAINVLNGKTYNGDGKLDYLASIWHLINNYSDDELLNLLFKNNIVLQNSMSLKELIKEKEEKISYLNEKIKEILSVEKTNTTRYKNKSIYCEDGHIVKSNGEFRIDQFLYKNNIVHAYEKVITLKDGSQIHPDFYIPEIDVYIEYHGVKGSAWYNKMNKYKDNIYKLEQMTVIVISHKQEEQIEKILPVLLNQNGLNMTFK